MLTNTLRTRLHSGLADDVFAASAGIATKAGPTVRAPRLRDVPRRPNFIVQISDPGGTATTVP